MSRITFIEFDGTEHDVDLEEGKSLMQLAIDNAIPSIDGDCGGECACGTCHVILESSLILKVGAATQNELQMLDLAPEKTANSRLACQVKVSADMSGIVVRLPEYQM